jgi:hypothetical protein
MATKHRQQISPSEPSLKCFAESVALQFFKRSEVWANVLSIKAKFVFYVGYFSGPSLEVFPKILPF